MTSWALKLKIFFGLAFLALIAAGGYTLYSEQLFDDIALWIGILSIPSWLRLIYGIAGRRYGFYDPALYPKLPRVPWRELFWIHWKKLTVWLELFSFGKKATAGWTSVLSQLCMHFRPGYLYLGRSRLWGGFPWFQPIGMKIVRHIVALAPTRTGKTNWIKSQLINLHRKCAAIIVDPRGDIYRQLASIQRELGRIVHCIDIFGITGDPTSSHNFSAEIHALNRRTGKDLATIIVDKIAHAMISKSENVNNPYFPLNSRLIWAAILLWVHLYEEEKTYRRARELLLFGLPDDLYAKEQVTDPETGKTFTVSNPRKAMDALWIRMAQCTEYGTYIAKVGSFMMTGKSPQEVLSTVRGDTAFLDHPQIIEATSRADFTFADHKGSSDWIFFSIPATEISDTVQPFIQTMLTLQAFAYEIIPGDLEHKCWVFCDELPAVGHVPVIQNAAPLMAGNGQIFVAVAQELEGLVRSYPHAWRGMLSGADAILIMGTNEQDTSEFVATNLGVRRVKVNGQYYNHPLMTADQVKRFLEPSRKNMIVLRFGDRALKLKRPDYYNECPVWTYAPDPHHGDSPARAWFRGIHRRYFSHRIPSEPPHDEPIHMHQQEHHAARSPAHTQIVERQHHEYH